MIFLFKKAPSWILAGVLLCLSPLAQTQTNAAPTTQKPVDYGCCGPILPAGSELRSFLDGMHVDQLWQAHEHINWETGEPSHGGHGHEPPTHCSAFAAAAAKLLGIYIMRPPDHSEEMLSLGQERWLESKEAADEGWREVVSPKAAQTLANGGYFVVLVYGREHGSGHIAIVRPAVKSEKALKNDGPETTQAGGHNFSDGTAVYSFVFHPGAWPDKVKIFAHPTKFQTENQTQSVR